MQRLIMLLSVLFLFLTSCSKENTMTMNQIAEAYVKLTLKIGLYDADYVDAYYGPAEWRPAPDTVKSDDSTQIRALEKETDMLLSQLKALPRTNFTELDELRHKFLHKQLIAARTKTQMLLGRKLTFDEEAAELYDAQPPKYDQPHFEEILKKLEGILPGKGDIIDRANKFRDQFAIPKAKLDTVFKAAIAEGRRRTLQRIKMPENESFVVEYVTNVPWSGYNWFKGNSFSVIQVNTDYPIFIDRAVDLASHEGYPGHHVFNTLVENRMMKEKGWMEYSVMPLFTPQALLMEGSANYGIDVAFPASDRMRFEKEILFPLAGLDSSLAEKYYEIEHLKKELAYSGNEAARGYLNGTMSKEEAIQWLVHYGLYPRDRAEQRIRFMDKYRAYVINYNLGQDMVAQYIERNGGTPDNPDKRWQLFEQLLSTPRTPSGLK